MQDFLYWIFFTAISGVVCSSVSVDDPIANGVIGQKMYLRWYFTITKDDTVNQIQVYINETKAKFEILNGISPILQDYGMKLFKDRLFATFSRNVYTIALQNLRLNDTYRFVLLAQFAKKENVKDIKFSEVFIKIADVIYPKDGEPLGIGMIVGIAVGALVFLIILGICASIILDHPPKCRYCTKTLKDKKPQKSGSPLVEKKLYLDGKNMEEKMSEEHSQMVCDAEDSTVQASKDREIELISRKVSRKRKVILKRKLSDTQCERNINTIAGELVSSGNIANAVQKSFSEATRSSIRENCGYTLKFAPDRMETCRRSLSSVENVIDKL